MLSTGLYAQGNHRANRPEVVEVEDDDNQKGPTEKVRSWEIGLNSTYLLRSIIPTYPYYGNELQQDQLVFRKYFSRRNVMKIGFKYNGINSDTNPNDSLTIGTASSDFEISLGYERYNRLAKRWRYFYGIDFGFGSASQEYTYSSADPVYNYLKERTINGTYFSLEPNIGIQFLLTRRISLSTRTSFNAQFGNSDQIVSYYDPNTANNSTVSGTDNNFNFLFPSEIFLRFIL